MVKHWKQPWKYLVQLEYKHELSRQEIQPYQQVVQWKELVVWWKQLVVWWKELMVKLKHWQSAVHFYIFAKSPKPETKTTLQPLEKSVELRARFCKETVRSIETIFRHALQRNGKVPSKEASKQSWVANYSDARFGGSYDW